MIFLDVQLATTEENRAAFKALLAETMAGSQAEPGCLIYRFTADLENPSLFYLSELWESEGALMDHARGAPFKNFLATLPSCGSVLKSVARSGDLNPYSFRRPA
ncbi:MAG: hypothetical protein JWR77_1944 [Rhizorhabdus sp.]|nr:hypothetical protein [Rhizorhabdus sp.]